LFNLQFIHANGEKRFSYGARKRGCFYSIGVINDLVIVGEGWATMATVHLATGKTCIAALDAGNLEPVIEELRRKYPDLTIIIAADDDRWKPEIGNIGITKANAAARRFYCTVALPWFRDNSSKPKDWNDLHVLEGLDEVKAQLAGVLDASR
jgi:putative DNA primase/helicase